MSLGIIQDIIPGWNSRPPFKPWLRQANPSEEKRGVTVGGWQLLREIGTWSNVATVMKHWRYRTVTRCGTTQTSYRLLCVTTLKEQSNVLIISTRHRRRTGRRTSSLLDTAGGLEEEQRHTQTSIWSSKTWSGNQRKKWMLWRLRETQDALANSPPWGRSHKKRRKITDWRKISICQLSFSRKEKRMGRICLFGSMQRREDQE